MRLCHKDAGSRGNWLEGIAPGRIGDHASDERIMSKQDGESPGTQDAVRKGGDKRRGSGPQRQTQEKNGIRNAPLGNIA